MVFCDLKFEVSFVQVHRAVLHNGEKVVVKVQRPGLKKLFDIDLRKNILFLSTLQQYCVLNCKFFRTAFLVLLCSNNYLHFCFS